MCPEDGLQEMLYSIIVTFIYRNDVNLYSLLLFEASQTSKVNVTLSGVTVCCQEISRRAVNTVSFYLKWDVQSVHGHWTTPGLPVIFVVEIRANVSQGLTSWTPFIVSFLTVLFNLNCLKFVSKYLRKNVNNNFAASCLNSFRCLIYPHLACISCMYINRYQYFLIF